MTYLVDANVLSEPTKVRPDSKIVDWLTMHEGDFVVDSIILGELSFGVLALPRGRKRERLEQWFEAVVSAIECLPWDAAVSLRWARLVVELRKKGRCLPVHYVADSRGCAIYGWQFLSRSDFSWSGSLHRRRR